MSFGYSVYFTERARNRVIRWDPDSGDAEVVAGEPANRDPQHSLNEPYGLAFSQDGSLIVADKGNHRICRVKNRQLTPLNLRDTTGHRARRPESLPGYSPELLCPAGLFAATDSTLYCAFADDFTIYRIHADGRLELILGRTRNSPYTFDEYREHVLPPQVPSTPIAVPTGLVVKEDGTIFFIERLPQTIREFHPQRGIRSLFPVEGASRWVGIREAPPRCDISEYHPAYPGTVALDPSGALYMSDCTHGAVLHIDFTACEVVRKLSVPLRSDQERGGPAAFTFGPDGTAWVLNSTSRAVEAYDTHGPTNWRKTSVALSTIRGEQLKLPEAGSGIVIGQ
jgi:sugar lactone lactonase YvrE